MHWQDIDRESIVDLVLSRSNVSTLDEEARAAKLAEVLAFYDDFGRGQDGMQLPYITQCYRARVIDRLDPGRRRPRRDATPTDPAHERRDGHRHAAHRLPLTAGGPKPPRALADEDKSR